MNEARHEMLTNAEYHAHPAVGASALECFRESRRTYFARYVAKTEPCPPPSAAMQLGTLVHLRLLEPDKFAGAVAEPYPELAPDGKKWLRREGSDHQKQWQAEVEKRRGLIACEPDELARVEKIVAAIRENEYASRLLAQEGESEFTIFWTDKTTGLECKCRVDYMPTAILSDPELVAVDLKTAADPSPQAYASALVHLGYHRKLRHYQAGLNAYVGKQQNFVHIAAGTSSPFIVAIYDIDDRDARDGFPLGQEQRGRMLRNLKDCIDSNDWREPYEKSVVTLSLPSWAASEESYQY